MLAEEKPKGLLLLSGGIDSPVAGWMVMRAGYPLAAVHFSSEPFVGPEVAGKCAVICEKIGIKEFEAIDIGRMLERMAAEGKFDFYFVLQKRLMLRLACRAAARLGCSFLVTGENLGQVSSQTLRNLYAINPASSLPVVRPLISFNKEDIISIARKIGTFEISKGPEACCVLGPKHPSTAARLGDVIEAERLLFGE
jgi:thiamine biosynthesis protein ThiI